MTVAASGQEIVERTLARAGLRLERLDKPIHRHQEKLGQLILEDQRRKAGKEFFFVQIGACDGISFDFLYDFVTEHGLRGIAVEPLPDLFQELRANYSCYPSVKPVNVGLHRTAKEIKMFRISPTATNLPAWVKGMASMDADHHKQYDVPSEHVIEEQVPCISWDELLNQQQITRIDYLQLDTEGYDYEILEMIDFARIRPAVIKFEHDVPTRRANSQLLAKWVAKFVENDYHVLTLPHDAIAYSRLSVHPEKAGTNNS